MNSIVIIGGGLGGLSTGALLAKRGYKVTLLEQHNIVGGCATIFKRKGGFTCEVGLHEMNGVYDYPDIKKMFDELGVYDNVEFVKPKEFFKVHYKGGSFNMPDGFLQAKTALKKRFPRESEGIDKYFEAMDEVVKAYAKLAKAKWHELALFPFFFYPIIKYKNKSVKDVLDSIIKDDELKLILNTNVYYYNDSPNTLSFLLHSMAQNSYYKDGGYFIKGGSYKLSSYLAEVITKNGGQIITKANVIKASKNEVIYENKKENKAIKADIIVSNISPQDTYNLFDINYIEKNKYADSITTIYLGFSKKLKDIYGKGPYSNFIFDELKSADEMDSLAFSDVRQKGFVFVDYSQIDAGLTDESKSFGEICLIDHLDQWDKLSKEEYQAKKEKLLQVVLDKLEKYYPNIKEYVEYSEVGTPKTMQRYLRTPNGTAYGYKPTPQQYFRIPKLKSDKVDNLYFTGQFVLGGGFSAALLSGSMCCEKILKDS